MLSDLLIESTDIGADAPPPPRGSLMGLEVTNFGEEAPVVDLPMLDVEEPASELVDIPMLDMEPSVEAVAELPLVEPEPMISLEPPSVELEAPTSGMTISNCWKSCTLVRWTSRPSIRRLRSLTCP